MKIGSREVGGRAPCFVVAEAGVAHEGSLDLAKQLVDFAVRVEADAVKFQVYKTEELVNRKRAPGLYARMKAKELSYDQFRELREYAGNRGIMWFATPHTVGALEFLKSLDVPVFKVGSGEQGKGPIVEAARASGKPLIISTGLMGHGEIRDLVSKGGGNEAFLYCVTMYPVPDDLANLAFMGTLRGWCGASGAVPGYSCHVVGFDSCMMAVVLGAKIVEKHIKLSVSTGQDTYGALNGADFKKMVGRIRRWEKMLGSEERIYSREEREAEKWALKGEDGLRPRY